MDDFFFSSDMLFKDVDFPATEESLVRHGKSPTGQIQWKRPGVSVGTLNVRMEYTGSMWGGQCGKVCVDTTVWESLSCDDTVGTTDLCVAIRTQMWVYAVIG